MHTSVHLIHTALHFIVCYSMLGEFLKSLQCTVATKTQLRISLNVSSDTILIRRFLLLSNSCFKLLVLITVLGHALTMPGHRFCAQSALECVTVGRLSTFPTQLRSAHLLSAACP